MKNRKFHYCDKCGKKIENYERREEYGDFDDFNGKKYCLSCSLEENDE